MGSALARAARWNRVPDYLARASETISVTVQIESTAAVEAVEDILKLDGVDAIFVGPSDLAASMGLLGQQEHPEVRAKFRSCMEVGLAQTGDALAETVLRLDELPDIAELVAAFPKKG